MKTIVRHLDLPADRRVLVVSDIHGNRRALNRVLEKAGFCEKDILILEGDYIERCGENLAALRRVVELCSIPALLAALALGRRSRLGAGLMLGGGAANLYERRRHGRVYDYVRFPHAWGKWKRYVYNLADFAILLGAAALVLSRGRGGKSPRRP